MKTKEIAQFLNTIYPFALQESYDNSGLIIDFNKEVTAILIAFDVTIQTIEEAILNNVNLIISHHPIIFSGVKRFSVENSTDKIVMLAMQHQISMIAMHTNLDNSIDGVNGYIAKKLDLQNTRILRVEKNKLVKLITYVPHEFVGVVRDALFLNGAGNIGAYSNCSFNVQGEGTYKASENATPYVGARNEMHFEPETRIETIIPEYKLSSAIKSLKSVHPYEEVAYDVFPLLISNPYVGAGIIGEFKKPMGYDDFFSLLKEKFNLRAIKHSKIVKTEIEKIAFCGGSGSFLISDAIAAKADILITGDIKYHDYFIADDRIILADIGHFESEHHTIDIINDVLIKKFPNFAILKTKINSNPIEFYL